MGTKYTKYATGYAITIRGGVRVYTCPSEYFVYYCMCLYAIYCNILRTTRRDDEAFSLACLRVCYNPYEERGILSRCSRGAWARPSFARGQPSVRHGRVVAAAAGAAACLPPTLRDVSRPLGASGAVTRTVVKA